jgi:hypothetical protein
VSEGGTSKGEALLKHLLAAGALVLFLSGCDSPTSYHDSKFVYRAVDSPDGGSTARLARIVGGGAAGYLFYDVYLSKASSEESTELVFRGYGDCNLVSEWRGSEMLVVQYVGGSCSVSSFQSFWYPSDGERAESAPPKVEIVLERISPPSNAWNRQ